MENFLKILTMPDNIPIAVMFFASIFLGWLAFKKALKNDKLIKEGKEEKIIEEMEK